MSAVEQIKAEIERRIKKIKPQNGQGIVLCDQVTKQLQSLLSFINSLPQEKPCEDLEQKIEEDIYGSLYELGEGNICIMGGSGILTLDDVASIARYFAEWQKSKMLEKAICTEVGTTCGIPSIWLALKDCKQGDNIKVIIVKEDTK